MMSNKKAIGNLARLYMGIETLLEQIIPVYVKTGLPTEYAKEMFKLEEGFLAAADGLVQIMKTQRLEPRGHPVVFHGDMMFNLEQIVAWSEEMKQ